MKISGKLRIFSLPDYLEHSAIQVPPERDDNDGKHVEFEDQDLGRKRSSELSRRSIRKSGINKVSIEKDGRKLRHGRKASLKPLKKMSEHQNTRNDKLYALSSNSSDIQKKNKKKNKCNALYNLSTDQILQKIDSFEDKLFKKIFTVEEDQMHPNYSTNNIVYEIKHLEIKNNTANSFDSETTCGDQTPTLSTTGEIPAMQSPQSAQQMKLEEPQKPAENPGKLEQKIDSENSMKIQEIVESQEAKKEMEKSQLNDGIAGKFQVESQMETVEKANEKIKNETMENQVKLEEMKEEGAISMKIVGECSFFIISGRCGMILFSSVFFLLPFKFFLTLFWIFLIFWFYVFSNSLDFSKISWNLSQYSRISLHQYASVKNLVCQELGTQSTCLQTNRLIRFWVLWYYLFKLYLIFNFYYYL